MPKPASGWSGSRTLLVDQTGTLTEGEPSVVAIKSAPGIEVARLLHLAASLERHCQHPLGATIMRAAESRGALRGSRAGKGVTAPSLAERSWLQPPHAVIEAPKVYRPLAVAGVGIAMGRGSLRRQRETGPHPRRGRPRRHRPGAPAVRRHHDQHPPERHFHLSLQGRPDKAAGQFPPVLGLRRSPMLRRDGPCLALRLKGAKLSWPRLECH